MTQKTRRIDTPQGHAAFIVETTGAGVNCMKDRLKHAKSGTYAGHRDTVPE